MSPFKPWAALRRKLALLAIPLVRQTAHALGRLGTALPGEIALKIYPQLLADLSADHQLTLVTGTNGKSSVSALLAQMLRTDGQRVIHNEGGANMASGLVTALGLHRPALRQDHTQLVFEIDEAWFPKLASQLEPRYLIVSNLFRDQVDRNGDILAVRAKIARGIREAQEARADFQLILNADDPYVASLASEVGPAAPQPVFFGLAGASGLATSALAASEAADPGEASYPCPSCGATLTYQNRFYDHMGLYHCSACGFSHPSVDLCIGPGPEAGHYLLSYQAQEIDLDLGQRQNYVLANLAAASLAALELGVKGQTVRQVAQKPELLPGRDELVDLGQGRQAQIRLVKNPVGLSLGLQALELDPGVTGLLLMVNNQESDGRDISWLQEVNYQPLLAVQDRLAFVLVSGSRASDLGQILRERGLSPDLIRLESSIEEAWQQASDLLPAGQKLLVLPNYTPMWALQKILADRPRGA